MTRNYKNVRNAAAMLGESQLKFRIGLARQRTQIYPLDSMDFISSDMVIDALAFFGRSRKPAEIPIFVAHSNPTA